MESPESLYHLSHGHFDSGDIGFRLILTNACGMPNARKMSDPVRESPKVQQIQGFAVVVKIQ
jgi:hypothetical protein